MWAAGVLPISALSKCLTWFTLSMLRWFLLPHLKLPHLLLHLLQKTPPTTSPVFQDLTSPTRQPFGGELDHCGGFLFQCSMVCSHNIFSKTSCLVVFLHSNSVETYRFDHFTDELMKTLITHSKCQILLSTCWIQNNLLSAGEGGKKWKKESAKVIFSNIFP